MSSNVTGADVFVCYFQNMLSARRPPGLRPWTPLGDIDPLIILSTILFAPAWYNDTILRAVAPILNTHVRHRCPTPDNVDPPQTLRVYGTRRRPEWRRQWLVVAVQRIENDERLSLCWSPWPNKTFQTCCLHAWQQLHR